MVRSDLKLEILAYPARSLAVKFAVAFGVVLSSTVTHAVNYMDPNLSDRKDAIARAALTCSSFLRLSGEFKRCLNSNGVTEKSEQTDAVEQAASMASGTTLNMQNNGPQEPADVTAESTRAPASTSSKSTN